MNRPRSLQAAGPLWHRRSVLWALGAGVAQLLGCGGGGVDLAGVSSGGTGTFKTGVVSGFGSVIVNGVRYDDSQAQIRADDGTPGRSADLALGMVVSVQASAITPATTPGALASASARVIEYAREWAGPVQALAGDGFVLLGKKVLVQAATVLDGATLATLVPGTHYASVYGHLNAAADSLVATRVEFRTGAPEHWRLSGLVSDWSAGQRSFRLGSASIRYGSEVELPAGWGNGSLVRVHLQPTAGSEPWTAVRLQAIVSPLAGVAVGTEVEIEGRITALYSATRFAVGATEVDVQALAAVPSLSVGAKVEVQGRLNAGLIAAHSVKLESDDDHTSAEFEFVGSISALNLQARSFVVRGVTLVYDSTQAFDLHGAPWADGLTVEVKARLDGLARLVVTELEAKTDD